jgi:AP-4 complex subunit mu-1
VAKSFLYGSPQIVLAFQELSKQKGKFFTIELINVGKSIPLFDDYNLHECVSKDALETESVVTFSPPDGEFTLLNYRISSRFIFPFKITCQTEEMPNKVELAIQVNISMKIPLTN